MGDSDDENFGKPKEVKKCSICNIEHDLKSRADEFIDVHCSTLPIPHFASTQCIIVNINAHKEDFLKLICLECNRLIHPSIGSNIKEIKNPLADMAAKADAIKIDGYKKYPRPVSITEKNKNADLFALCSYDQELYFEKNRLIKICQNNHFAQPYKLEEQLLKSQNKISCPICSQPIIIDASLVKFNELMSKLQ